MRIIAGRWKGQRLKSPRGQDVRPTSDKVKEAWMSSLGMDVLGARVLDLFAGSGSLGLEALSRGAESVVFVEVSSVSLRTLKENIQLIKADSEITVVKRDAMKYIKRLGREEFDIALADPPYYSGYAAEVIKLFRDHPFASKLWIEHGKGDVDESPIEYDQRQYGKTTISILEAKR